jgi:hypothetical protein
VIGTVYDVLYKHTELFKRNKLVMTAKHVINQYDGSTVENGETLSTSAASVSVEQSNDGKYSKLTDSAQNPPIPGELCS